MKATEEIKKALEMCVSGKCATEKYRCQYLARKHFCIDGIMSDALACIEQLEKKTKWISVDEREPEFPCIVYDGENTPKIPGQIFTAVTADGVKRHFTFNPFEMLDFFQDQIGEEVDLSKVEMTHITHWMPLPEPPKEDLE